MNKKITTLATAILLVSSAQANFEVAFVAVDADGDTYVQNMGPYLPWVQNYSGQSFFDVSGVTAAIDAYTWTVVGAFSSSVCLAAPPAPGFNPCGSGVITTSVDDFTGFGTILAAPPGESRNIFNNEKETLEGWLSSVANLSEGSDSIVIPASSPNIYTVNQQMAFHGGRMQSGTGSFQLNEISDSILISKLFDLEYRDNMNECSIGGICLYNSVPVPAAAWLFGSALAGLGVVRSKK